MTSGGPGQLPGPRYCVYAIVPASSSARADPGPPFHLVRSGRVAAIVRRVTRPPAPSPETLRRYDRAVRELAALFPAILPARFATCVSEEELSFILTTRGPSLARALARVRGRAQMTIRVVTSQAGRPPAAAAGHSFRGATVRVAGRRSGRAYLRALARDAAAEREVPGFAPVRDAVRRWIRDERVDRRAGIATVYHLIPRASAAAYCAAVHEAAAAAALQVIVTGPWPPYAFGTSDQP